MKVYGEGAFEAAIEQSLLGSGWPQGIRTNYDRSLGLDTSELFAFVGATQNEAWLKLVAYHGNDVAETQRHFAEYLAKQIDERGPLDVLRRGIKDKGIQFQLAYFKPAHSITDDATKLYRANRLSVTRQLHYSAQDPKKSLDLVLFVNGIPLATAELKNPLTNQTVEDAKEQYRKDRDPRELLFSRRILVHFAVDPDLVFVTTKLAGDSTRFLPFNTGSEGPGVSGGAGNPSADDYRTAYLWEQIWHPDTWMDLMRRFLHTNKESRALIFPRYHQWHAVTTLTDHAAAHGSGDNYLVMHSAGSGKSNTIAWLAHRLSSLHTTQAIPDKNIKANEPVFDKVIIITDRVVLDRQLQDTVFQFEHVPGVVQRIDKDSNQLAAALTGEAAKVVISTMQKFGFILEKVDGLRGKRFAVIVDEAHSSQSGDNAASLKKVLLRKGSDDIDDDGDLLTASALARGRHETLSYFAFTATPKPKTLELFGTLGTDGNMHPFHTYSMRQAIEEGFILDVLRQYVTYKSYWKLANQNPEDPEVDPKQAASQLARFAVLHPTMMAQKAEIIVEHFRRHTAPRVGGRAKAMVVTGSREAAAKLYTAIKKYIATNEYAGCDPLVAFSGDLQLDGIEMTEAKLNGFGESELPEKFGYTAADDKHAGTPKAKQPVEYKILVVAEKYQTGFDQPLLTTMYVDKSLKGVAAVQTLSRLNRTHPLKMQDDVFVLDFVNEATDITEQFKPYFETAATMPTDPNLLYTAENSVMSYALLVESEMQAYVEALLAAEGKAKTDAALQKAHAALYRFTDPARDRYVALAADDPEAADAFRAALRDYTRMYAFLSQVVPYHDEHLERLYLYGRALLNRLPRRQDASVDIGEVQLTHLRVSKTGEHDASLEAEGEQMLPGFTGGGAGPQNDPDKVALSELIEELNDRFGLGLGDADKIWYEQQIVAMAEDPTVEAAALVNDEGNFGVVFDRHIESVILNRHDDNGKLMQRYLDDDLLRQRMNQLGRSQAYKLIRRKHGLT
ncbi:type I restriction endonuclease subunit R [Paractinoplanes abujensis]|uniref:Type I restriction enzyme R subunit n=1 Tax=Paractinoplanes abujensis TaxID=882441 RepID=A0A7W7CK18_9ACTN|nr:type I restriction endonuclease [Actinoplanes abujensis]MBB4689910.1 type I restriction enzyme R subunit [Actinoplanes abujensis]GID24686.1 type I restriction endonuclease subunit R [Actinoplanes abujensis]